VTDGGLNPLISGKAVMSVRRHGQVFFAESGSSRNRNTGKLSAI
jgi:hypothetical protein